MNAAAQPPSCSEEDPRGALCLSWAITVRASSERAHAWPCACAPGTHCELSESACCTARAACQPDHATVMPWRSLAASTGYSATPAARDEPCSWRSRITSNVNIGTIVGNVLQSRDWCKGCCAWHGIHGVETDMRRSASSVSIFLKLSPRIRRIELAALSGTHSTREMWIPADRTRRHECN